MNHSANYRALSLSTFVWILYAAANVQAAGPLPSISGPTVSQPSPESIAIDFQVTYTPFQCGNPGWCYNPWTSTWIEHPNGTTTQADGCTAIDYACDKDFISGCP